VWETLFAGLVGLVCPIFVEPIHQNIWFGQRFQMFNEFRTSPKQSICAKPCTFFLAEAIMAVTVVVAVVSVAADVGVLILALLSSCSCWCRWPQFSLVFLYLCLLVDNDFFPQSYGKRQRITQ
jgi:hypothetical protein